MAAHFVTGRHPPSSLDKLGKATSGWLFVSLYQLSKIGSLLFGNSHVRTVSSLHSLSSIMPWASGRRAFPTAATSGGGIHRAAAAKCAAINSWTSVCLPVGVSGRKARLIRRTGESQQGYAQFLQTMAILQTVHAFTRRTKWKSRRKQGKLCILNILNVLNASFRSSELGHQKLPVPQPHYPKYPLQLILTLDRLHRWPFSKTLGWCRNCPRATRHLPSWEGGQMEPLERTDVERKGA